MVTVLHLLPYDFLLQNATVIDKLCQFFHFKLRQV